MSLFLLPGSAAATPTDSWRPEIDVGWQVRLRAATLQEGELHGKAASGRLRTQAGLAWESIEALAEVDLVAALFKDDHSDGVRRNGEPEWTDVPGADLNQAWLGGDLQGLDWRLGRQRLTHANQRFLGSVAIWQNEQTFDALSLDYTPAEHSRLRYHYIDRALRIFGRESEDTDFPLKLGRHDHHSHFFSWELNLPTSHVLNLFALELNNETVPVQDSRTLGLMYRFKIKPGQLAWLLRSTIARQTRERINTDALHLWRLEAGFGYRHLTLTLAGERLEGNGQAAFITPLASLHDHQGSTDRFLQTPAEGLDDWQVRAIWRMRPFRLDLTWHQFRTVENTRNLGQETDFEISWEIQRRQSLRLQAAHFSPQHDSYSRATRVFLTYQIRG